MAIYYNHRYLLEKRNAFKRKLQGFEKYMIGSKKDERSRQI